ncbi:hypothetical protein EI94DRAFT_1709706 [Lactarius quietus]|nr:hypothetical protein EI94DRAFT_1709706 [Lactarius quietus]
MAEAGYQARGLPPYQEGCNPSPVTTCRTHASRHPVHSLSPTPSGFILNNGMNWVLMVIKHEGCRIPAKYVRVRMLDNPEVFRTMGRDMGPAAEYSHDELQYFHSDFQGKRQVDEALARLGDISLQAEVRRYCTSSEVIKELEAVIKKLEDDIFIHVDRL